MFPGNYNFADFLETIYNRSWFIPNLNVMICWAQHYRSFPNKQSLQFSCPHFISCGRRCRYAIYVCQKELVRYHLLLLPQSLETFLQSAINIHSAVDQLLRLWPSHIDRFHRQYLCLSLLCVIHSPNVITEFYIALFVNSNITVGVK